MIPYHGTPIGGRVIDRPRFLQGRHALVSFAHPEDLEIVAECCQSFVFDNGAFSAWRSGEPITDWVPYYEWVRKWIRHPGFDWCLMPDVIDGSEEANDLAIDDCLAWSGWRGRVQQKFVPVWHLHESIDRLKRLANEWPRIAFGSSGEFSQVGTRLWTDRMHEAFEAICEDGQPICGTHGLRMMDPAIFHRFPFASVDSTNVAQNGSREAAGKKTSMILGREIIAERIESHNSAATYRPADKQMTLVFH